MIKKADWIWMPHAGHFILSRNCEFHLNTYVGYIVSTIGELWCDSTIRRIYAEIHDLKWFNANKYLKGDVFDEAYMQKFGVAEIGYNRKYETMVFKAIKTENKCCPFEQVGDSIDFLSYNTADEATKGHYQLCGKWSKK